jgi:hypothetical protein
MLKRKDKINKQIFKVPEINYVTAGLGIFLALLISSIGRFFVPLENKDAIALFAAIIAIFALVYNAMALRTNFEVNFEKQELDKRIAAINIITEWYRDFTDEALTIKDLRKAQFVEQIKNEDFVKIIDGQKEFRGETKDYRKDLMPLMNYFEKISIAVLTEGANEEILKEYFGDIFHAYFEAFKPYIENRRKGVGALPNAYEHFVEVAEQWAPPTKSEIIEK